MYTNEQKIQIARDMISKIEKGHYKGEFAIDDKNELVFPKAPNACKFCAIGAFIASNDVNPLYDMGAWEKKGVDWINDNSCDLYGVIDSDPMIIEFVHSYITPDGRCGNNFASYIWAVNDGDDGKEFILNALEKYIDNLESQT